MVVGWLPHCHVCPRRLGSLRGRLGLGPWFGRATVPLPPLKVGIDPRGGSILSRRPLRHGVVEIERMPGREEPWERPARAKHQPMTQMQNNTWTVACNIHALVHAHHDVTLTIDSMRMHAMLLLDSHHRITPLLQLMLTLMAIHYFKITRVSLGSNSQRALMANGSFIYIYGHACSRDSPKKTLCRPQSISGEGEALRSR